MQLSTILVLVCLIAVVVAQAVQESQPAEQTLQESLYDTPTHENSQRNKRGLLLLKKKLLLGALGLKAAKVGAGAAVVGAIALKSKPKSVAHTTTYYHPGPHPGVSVDVDLHHRELPLIIKY